MSSDYYDGLERAATCADDYARDLEKWAKHQATRGHHAQARQAEERALVVRDVAAEIRKLVAPPAPASELSEEPLFGPGVEAAIAAQEFLGEPPEAKAWREPVVLVPVTKPAPAGEPRIIHAPDCGCGQCVAEPPEPKTGEACPKCSGTGLIRVRSSTCWDTGMQYCQCVIDRTLSAPDERESGGRDENG